MEDSMSSYVNSALYSKEASATSSEESGWTMYIEDFLASEEKRRGAFDLSSSSEASSMVSDAASSAAWKQQQQQQPSASVDAAAAVGKRLIRLKKKRVWGNLEEDPLEDTASSPVNSPKVSGLTHPDLNTMKKDENREISKEVVAAGYGNDSVLGREVVSQLGLVDRASNDCTELKKRGLCLVPMSMLVDYLG
ncbi:uncharacterized protein LOC109712426 [Ananas comosus]|uniref:Uncharacterized protein LOC109712426 n=1 Tax=Ananas comosus TaxID=4615 RepID=A0A6P5FE39_ANACO|nr:uncharacterized protein LOC109712426 [Ananas comosus]